MSTTSDTAFAATFVIRRRTPSLNDWANKRGMGQQFAYKKERNAWAALLLGAGVFARVPPTFRMHVTITSHRIGELDHANLVGGCKPIIDLLVRAGWLHDDAPTWFFGEYFQHRCKRPDIRTCIHIRPFSTTPQKGT